MNKSLDRFLRYVRINTTSDEQAFTSPSSKGQWDLARLLEMELQQLGCQQVRLDNNCYVYGLLPANVEGQPTIALIAHMDTVDAVPGRDFKPRVVQYEGGDILLNQDLDIRLSPTQFPVLSDYIGQELVVTDGTTVLGADDKAGVAEIMTAAEILMSDPQIRHGDVWLVFTPDEEIGSGADLLDLDYIKADFGYTADGGALNELEYENFNAASAHIEIQGRNVHPGYAKGQMINALKVAMELHSLLPQEECPELTQDYEGFFHLRNLQGTEDAAVMDYLIRDHDKAAYEQRKLLMADVVGRINQKYGEERVQLKLSDSYSNMHEVIVQHPHVLKRAEKAIRACGMEPVNHPIRGGTDGARLSFRGLPCPNLGTGGVNWHSVYEFLPVQALEKMAKVLVEIVRA